MGKRRLVMLMLVVAILLALPTAVLASKRLYKARLSTGAELHQVVDSNASGAANLAIQADGSMRFVVSVRNLSGAPTGAHLHGPATTSENAPVILSLCGSPAPAALATCDFDSSTNSMVIQGDITSSLLAQWGLPAAQLRSWLEDGLVYVNVHTSSNPAGEARGQFAEQ